MTQKKPDIKVETVTPELAKRWLEKNDQDQRAVSTASVMAMARDMRAGAWVLTHQGLCFNHEGYLVDGQHRLLAVIESGCSVDMVVSRGMTLEVRSPIDAGTRRSNQYFTGKTTHWNAAVGLLGRLCENDWGNSRMTPAYLLATYDEHAEEVDACMAEMKSKKLYPSTLSAAAMYAYPIHPEKVLSFIQQVRTGELLSRGDPAYAYRNWYSRGLADAYVRTSAVRAALNCLMYELQGKKVVHVVSSAVAGYVWTTTRRRALKISHTPAVAEVSYK